MRADSSVEERNVWIRMPDGIRLQATLYMPEGAGPHATILEALPYRKDDVTAYDTPEYRRLRDEGGFEWIWEVLLVLTVAPAVVYGIASLNHIPIV
jgi:predicted acyl esterase